MADLQLVADLNISPQTVTALRLSGWDLIRVSEVLLGTAADIEILEFARLENRVLLTQDLDFSTLVALGDYNQPSLITLRLSSADPNTVSQKLLDTLPSLETELQQGCTITIEDTSVRIRRLPI